ncbi:MAG: hypothetical protein VX642_10940 [Bdellovibrionota bacterium]|nr:hypothetical protein [Bdellovibrionota bacterium]
MEVDILEISILKNTGRERLDLSGNFEEEICSLLTSQFPVSFNFFEVKSISGDLYKEKRVSKNQKKRQAQIAMHLYSMGFDQLCFYDVFVSSTKIYVRKREDW